VILAAVVKRYVVEGKKLTSAKLTPSCPSPIGGLR